MGMSKIELGLGHKPGGFGLEPVLLNTEQQTVAPLTQVFLNSIILYF